MYINECTYIYNVLEYMNEILKSHDRFYLYLKPFLMSPFHLLIDYSTTLPNGTQNRDFILPIQHLSLFIHYVTTEQVITDYPIDWEF